MIKEKAALAVLDSLITPKQRRKLCPFELSDDTIVKGIPWRTLKHKLFEPEFDQKGFFVSSLVIF